MRPITNSIKHFVHTPAAGIASGASTGTSIIVTVAKGAARATTANVEEGAIIKAVYIEWWVKADNPNFTVNSAVIKLPSGTAGPTFAELQNLSAYINKKNIFEFHQGLAPSGDQTLAMFRHWIKIPKGKQRFGLGDSLKVFTSFTGSAGDICGVFIYKEYE